MELRLACPDCGGHILAEDDVLGESATCPHCRAEFTATQSLMVDSAEPDCPSTEDDKKSKPGRITRILRRLPWRRLSLVLLCLLVLADLVYIHTLLRSTVSASRSAARGAWTVEHEISGSGYQNTFSKRIEDVEDALDDIERTLKSHGSYLTDITHELTSDRAYSDTVKTQLNDIESDVNSIQHRVGQIASDVDDIESKVKDILKNM